MCAGALYSTSYDSENPDATTATENPDATTTTENPDPKSQRAYVLIAAHCFGNKPEDKVQDDWPLLFHIVTVEHIFPDGNLITYPVEHIKFHPLWTSPETMHLLGDLAVLIIKNPDDGKLWIQDEKPINLPNELYYPNGKAFT